MQSNTVFISYNPNNEFEQTLAVRLHTIGAVHGLTMFMPDRFNNSNKISAETEYRIKSSDYFILFSTSVLTPVVLQVVKVAFDHLKDKSKILIIYNKVKNLKLHQNCTEVLIDAGKDKPQEILDKIIEEINNNKNNQLKRKNDSGTETLNILGGILLIGLGLLALDNIINPKKK